MSNNVKLSVKSENVSTLSLMPYYDVTNVELYDILENVDTYIKSCLANRNFSKYINSTLPDNTGEITCRYYTSEELSNLLSNDNSEGLKMIHHNIRSLDLHFGEMISLMQTFHNKFNIIALSEIGKKNIENRAAMLQHYGLGVKYELPSLSKGGVALIFNNNLQIIERQDLKIKKQYDNNCKIEVEDVWVEIKCMVNNRNESYIVGVVYRHPGGTIDGLHYFTKKIEEIMRVANCENKKCIIMGDINIDGLRIDTNDHVESFFKTVMENDFIPTITLPTRVVDTSVSLIDHVIVNRNVLKDNVYTGNLYCGMTDHMPNFIVIKSQSIVMNSDRPFVRIYGENNMSQFRNCIQTIAWNDFYQEKDPNTALEFFIKHLTQHSINPFLSKNYLEPGLKIKNGLLQASKNVLNTETTCIEYIY